MKFIDSSCQYDRVNYLYYSPKLLIYWLEGSLMQEDILYPEEYLGKEMAGY
jgi:hypothetical protein